MLNRIAKWLGYKRIPVGWSYLGNRRAVRQLFKWERRHGQS